jgi:hypothetical protein
MCFRDHYIVSGDCKHDSQHSWFIKSNLQFKYHAWNHLGFDEDQSSSRNRANSDMMGAVKSKLLSKRNMEQTIHSVMSQNDPSVRDN